ncbi:MAG TPA: hypothetical protein VJ810_03740 [Blastocatellia bacterium]|nr:hypothetical protein [Blastocatellia bacterium]
MTFMLRATFCLSLLVGVAVLLALTLSLTSIVYLLLLDIGLICGERRRFIVFDGGDHRLHQDMRNTKAKLPAPEQIFSCLPACPKSGGFSRPITGND